MDKKLIIRYILLILGVTIMSLGIALSLKSTLGTPPISCIPAVLAVQCLACHIPNGAFEKNHIITNSSNACLHSIWLYDRF